MDLHKALVTTAPNACCCCRCLVLDSRYLPVNVISWFRAVVMDASGKVRHSMALMFCLFVLQLQELPQMRQQHV
jgi:hypothetical protein